MLDWRSILVDLGTAQEHLRGQWFRGEWIIGPPLWFSSVLESHPSCRPPKRTRVAWAQEEGTSDGGKESKWYYQGEEMFLLPRSILRSSFSNLTFKAPALLELTDSPECDRNMTDFSRVWQTPQEYDKVLQEVWQTLTVPLTYNIVNNLLALVTQIFVDFLIYIVQPKLCKIS